MKKAFLRPVALVAAALSPLATNASHSGEVALNPQERVASDNFV